MDNKKRTALQSAAALLQNANLKGFFTGQIYQGQGKRVCVPGLNCYSCPGAAASCPIGSLQNALSDYKFRFPYYVVGLMLFFGVLLGRAVCGFLCPFGFLQDLLYRIPFFKKIQSFKGDKALRKLKYIVLIVMVIILPFFVKLTPFFCKYLCPSGTLAGILLILSDTTLFQVLGKLFVWKVVVLAAAVMSGMMISRPFCRYLCPLGAFYGPLNKIAFLRLTVDPDQCIHCSCCSRCCDMCVDPVTSPNDPECIRCGKCITVCPKGALSYRISGKGDVFAPHSGWGVNYSDFRDIDEKFD